MKKSVLKVHAIVKLCHPNKRSGEKVHFSSKLFSKSTEELGNPCIVKGALY